MRIPGRTVRPPLRRPLGLALAVVITTLAALCAPAAAEDPAPAPEASPRIVGGTVAPPGAWPSQVAIYSSASPSSFRCGGTVIDPSWILTAAHCQTSSTSSLRVLAGTQVRNSGGTWHQVREMRIVPGYDPDPNPHRDVALIHLTEPTSVPLQSLIAPWAAVAPGTPAVATGWGSTTPPPNLNVQNELREVTVPTISDDECRDAGYVGLDAIVSASMLCAGERFGGKDTCNGDSGGPLVIDQGGVYRQIGITSWGIGCGSYPGVYTKVASFTDWIRQQIRYGPHTDAAAFVRGTYRDLFGREATSAEQANGVTALAGQTPSAWVLGLIDGPTYQSRIGGVTRLYRAFFLRNPDTSGLKYWAAQINGGRTLTSIASFMAASPEFIDRYGALDNAAFVDLVYQNVLDRPADPGGAAFWTNQLNTGQRTRGQVMVGFSESQEYRTATRDEVEVIITFFGLVRRVPCACDIDFWAGTPTINLIAALLASPEYAGRF